MNPQITPAAAGSSHDAWEAPVIRSILVVVDPTAGVQHAVDKAAKIAAILGSALELYICDIERVDGAELQEARQRLLTDGLSEFAESLRKRGLRVTTHYERHAPLAEGIAFHVLRTRPDLVVKAAHRHETSAAEHCAGTDRALIGQLPSPLLLVRARPWQQSLAIAVAVDPCHIAERPKTLDTTLVALGCLFSNGLAGKLEAWHVLEPPPHLPGEPATPIEIARASGAAREAVADVLERASNLPNAIPTHFIPGAPANGIARFARERKPDLLLLGAAARPRWAPSASGTAAQLLDQFEGDLLIVKPEGFVSPLLVND